MAKIFCCNSGRCGSKYIARTFDYLTDIPSFHEQIPWCVNKVNQEVNDSVELSRESSFILHEKVRRIIEYSKGGNYLDTTQMFIKSMVDAVLLNFQDVYVIYLERNLEDVLLSYYRKCWHKEIDWFLQPQWRKNILKKEGEFSFMDIVEWNWHEIKARYEYYKPKFAKTYEFDFRDINNLDAYYAMFEHFGIEYKKVKRLPSNFSKYRNSLVAVEKKYAKTSKEKIRKEMLENWDLPPMQRWRFPLDIQQINSGK